MARKGRRKGHTIGKPVKMPMMGVTRPQSRSLIVGTLYGKLRRR